MDHYIKCVFEVVLRSNGRIFKSFKKQTSEILNLTLNFLEVLVCVCVAGLALWWQHWWNVEKISQVSNFHYSGPCLM